jgi:hypothetical protein
MTSRSDTQSVGEQYLRLDAGTQALVACDSLQPSLSLLPPSAYGNLLVVSPKSPRAVERTIRESGGDVEKVGHLPLASTAHGYDGPMWTAEAIDPSDLTGLSMQYSRAIEALAADHGWVLFDEFNALLLYCDGDRVVRFLDHTARQTREADLRGVYTVVRDAMDDRTFASLRNVVDTDVDVR